MNYKIRKETYPVDISVFTDNVKAVMKMFGITKEHLDRKRTCECEIELNDGDICLIVGCSGSGKTTLFDAMMFGTPQDERIYMDGIPIPTNKSTIDCFEGTFFQSLKVLSKAGMNDVYTILQKPSSLSDGQQQRYRLAKAIESGKKYIFADGFLDGLDRITAAVLAYNMHKQAQRTGTIFVLAVCNEDIMTDLCPDAVVLMKTISRPEVIYRGKK